MIQRSTQASLILLQQLHLDFGHSLIRPTFDILDKGFNPTGNPLPLRQLFFNNTFIRERGIDELMLGLLETKSQRVDRKLADGILNNLFERENSPGPQPGCSEYPTWKRSRFAWV